MAWKVVLYCSTRASICSHALIPLSQTRLMVMPCSCTSISLQPFVRTRLDCGALFVYKHQSPALCFKHVWIVVPCLCTRISLQRLIMGSCLAEPSLAGLAVMVQWHPQKRCPEFLVGRTQFFGGKSCPGNFARVPDWCCHALATMAGLATSHCVECSLMGKRNSNCTCRCPSCSGRSSDFVGPSEKLVSF